VQIYRSHISPNQNIRSQMLSQHRQQFAKLPNQNICSQTLPKFARFPGSPDKFANMTNLRGKEITKQWYSYKTIALFTLFDEVE